VRRRRAGLRGAGLHQRGPPPPIHARAWAGPPAAIDAGRPDRYTGRLTVPLASRYKAALVAVLATVPALALPDVRVAGAILPDGAEKVAENRYRVPRSYEDTVKFFKQTYGARYTRRPIADQPGVKAVHIENPDARPGSWDGLNVYELQGEVRVFVLVKGK